MNIKYGNAKNPLGVGFHDIGGYVLAFVTNNAYNNSKIVQVYWTGVRYAMAPNLELTAAYYGYHQNAYGTGNQTGCSSTAHNTCDMYAGAMYSGVHGGAASGYIYSTNINPTIGVRYKL
jgi:hypothetical protein